MEINADVYNQIKSCLEELSDIEFQKRIWLHGEGPEVSSYVEVVCQLFDDTGIGDIINEPEEGVVVSEALDPILRELSDIFDSLDYKIGTERILNHPKWLRVIEIASQAVKIL